MDLSKVFGLGYLSSFTLNFLNKKIYLELYKKIKKNDLISINPSVIHFTGFEPQCKYWQKFELVNMSSDIQRFHVIPPQSKYFKVSYTKNVSFCS